MSLHIYLDTSDYVRLYQSKSCDDKAILSYLKEKIEKKDIAICFSCINIFEFLQPYEPDFFEERLSRAKFMKEICLSNCFKYITDIKTEREIFSADGIWFPVENIRTMCVENLVQKLIENIYKKTKIRLSIKKLYSIMSNTDIDYTELTYVFPKNMIESGMLTRHFSGKVSKSIINAQLLKSISDIELFFINAFDKYACGDMFFRPLQNISKSIHTLFSTINLLNIRHDADSFKAIFRENSNQLLLLFPEYFIEIITSFLIFNLKNNNNAKLQPSDAGDILNALYIPYSDLWRGDKHFSNILIREKIKHADRIVDNLKDLPKRLDELLLDVVADRKTGETQPCRDFDRQG